LISLNKCCSFFQVPDPPFSYTILYSHDSVRFSHTILKELELFLRMTEAAF